MLCIYQITLRLLPLRGARAEWSNRGRRWSLRPSTNRPRHVSKLWNIMKHSEKTLGKLKNHKSCKRLILGSRLSPRQAAADRQRFRGSRTTRVLQKEISAKNEHGQRWFPDGQRSMIEKLCFDGSGPSQQICPKSCQNKLPKVVKNCLNQNLGQLRKNILEFNN